MGHLDWVPLRIGDTLASRAAARFFLPPPHSHPGSDAKPAGPAPPPGPANSSSRETQLIPRPLDILAMTLRRVAQRHPSP
jgi:hypothetical protein